MTLRFRPRPLVAAALLAAGACAPPPIHLPSPESPRPVAGDTGGLRAGFARVDITPPPGPGMIGWGTEGRRARGWRGRMYARAMVLEDRAGERIALVQERPALIGVGIGIVGPAGQGLVHGRRGRFAVSAATTSSRPNWARRSRQRWGCCVGGCSARLAP